MDSKDRQPTTASDRDAQMAREGGFIPRARRPLLPTTPIEPDPTRGVSADDQLAGHPYDQGRAGEVTPTNDGPPQYAIPPRRPTITPNALGQYDQSTGNLLQPDPQPGRTEAAQQTNDQPDEPDENQGGWFSNLRGRIPIIGRRNNPASAPAQPARRVANPPLPNSPHTIGGSKWIDTDAPSPTNDARERARIDAELAAALIRNRGNINRPGVHDTDGGLVLQPNIPEGTDGGGNEPDNNNRYTEPGRLRRAWVEHRGKLVYVGGGVALGLLGKVLNIDPDYLRGSIRIAAGAGGAFAASGMGEYISHWVWARTPDNSKLEAIADKFEVVSMRLKQASMMAALTAGGLAAEEAVSNPDKFIEALKQVPSDYKGLVTDPVGTVKETIDNLGDVFDSENPTPVPAATATTTAPVSAATPTAPETPTPTPIATATNTPDTGVTTSGTPQPTATTPGTPTVATPTSTATNTPTPTPTVIASPSPSPSPLPSPSPSASPGTGSAPGSLPPFVDNPPGGGEPGTGGGKPPLPATVGQGQNAGAGAVSGVIQQHEPVTHVDPSRGWREQPSGFQDDPTTNPQAPRFDDPPDRTDPNRGWQEQSSGFQDDPENKIDISQEYDFVSTYGHKVQGNLDNLTFDGKNWKLVDNAVNNLNHYMQQHDIEGYKVNVDRLKEDLYPTVGLWGHDQLVPGSKEYNDFHLANGTQEVIKQIMADPELAQDYKNRGILILETTESTPALDTTQPVDNIPGQVPEITDQPFNLTSPDGTHTITGSIFDDTLQWDKKDWNLVGNGVKNIDDYITHHGIEGYRIDEDQLKQALHATIPMYAGSELQPGTPEFKLFNFANGTDSVYEDIFNDPAFVEDLKNKGILVLDIAEPMISNHVDVDRGYQEKTSGYNDDPAVNPEAPQRDKYGIIVDHVDPDRGYQEKTSGFQDDPTTNPQAPRFDDPPNLVDPDRGYQEKTSGYNDDPAVNPEAPQRDKYGIIVDHVDPDRGYQEKTSGYNDDPAVNPEATPYHKPLELVAPYGGHTITGSIFDGTLKFGDKDWLIFENGERHIKEIATLQNYNEPYYIDQDKYKEELEKLIILWSKGELTDPEDQKVFYLSDGVPGEYDKLKEDPATIQTLKDKGIIKTR